MHTLPTLLSPPAAQPSQSSLRDARFPFLSPAVTSSPGRGKSFLKAGALGNPRKVHLFAKASPFEERLPPRRGKMSRSDKRGSVDANAVSRRRGLARSLQRGCFRRKPALQMPLSSTTLPVKMQCRTVRRLPGIVLIKIILPLNMARAKRKPFKIVRPALPQALRLTARRGSGCTPPWKRNGRGCARPSGGWWTGPWERTGLPTGSGGWRCTAAPASPAG